MQDLLNLQQKLVKFRDERDWKQFHTPKDIAISVALEAAELLEHFQWKSADDVEELLKTKKTEIAEEMADVFNWIVLLSHDLGIDIIRVANDKIESNSRKYPIDKSKGSAKKYTELR
jgi:NTP pyrophosphatase (non-canonical NTP hydrolase)